MLRGHASVVTRDECHVHDLLEAVAASLAGLKLDDVEDVLAVVEHQVVEAQQDALALLEAGRSPSPLRVAGAPDSSSDVIGGATRHRRERLAGGGVLDLDRLAVAVADAHEPGEAGDLRGCYWTSKHNWKKSSITGGGLSEGPS